MEKIDLMLKFLFKTILFLLFTNLSFGQDTIRVMYYNILKFPTDYPEKVDTLRKIIQYVQPDLFLVQELQTNAAANLILSNSLNVFGTTHYEKAVFYNGPDTDNMLFYNSDKFTLYSQHQITTPLRDISEYIVYYNDPNLSASSDTIFLNLYSCHLKAGDTSQDERNVEAITFKNYLDTRTNLENVIFGGDFNVYTSDEPAFITLTTYGKTLYDPIDRLGNWHNNIAFVDIHTQSTRTTSLSDGGATGGMDDRFDIILTSFDALNLKKGIGYIPNTYKAVGQDGLRFNGTMLSPSNTVVPDSVSRALYYMSDHLPIIMDFEVDYTFNSVKNNDVSKIEMYYSSINNTVKLNKEIQNFYCSLFDLSGKNVFQKHFQNTDEIVLPNNLHNGLYIFYLVDENKVSTLKLVINLR